MDWRVRAIEQMTERPLDVLVIGGGILGAGVARDAAMRELRVGLLDQHDFSFGTSSRSSRLLHGGLRYLAQGRLGLVREAGREKAILAKIAPHLAVPLAFTFPTYRGTQWQKWKLGIGVKLYDMLCGVPDAPRSRTISRERAIEELPMLRREGLTGAVGYGDGLTNDARLVIDTLRSAQRHGAILLNYAAMNGAQFAGGEWTCRGKDELEGETFEVRAKVLVNAAGPWAHGFAQSGLKLRLTKGVHLVIDAKRLPIREAVVMTEGSRILFAIPYGDRVILGTTDTDYNGRPEVVKTDKADVEYVLRIVNQTFPEARITVGDVITDWSGIRPLISGTAGSPSDTSRKHLIRHTNEGWIDVAGGKLTTYRHIAEETMDVAVKLLGKTAGECKTADEALLAGEQGPTVSGLLPPEPTDETIRHFCQREWAVHLDDVMARRGRWDTYSPDAVKIARQVARVMARELQWDETKLGEELSRWRGSSSSFLK